MNSLIAILDLLMIIRLQQSFLLSRKAVYFLRLRTSILRNGLLEDHKKCKTDEKVHKQNQIRYHPLEILHISSQRSNFLLLMLVSQARLSQDPTTQNYFGIAEALFTFFLYCSEKIVFRHAKSQ